MVSSSWIFRFLGFGFWACQNDFNVFRFAASEGVAADTQADCQQERATLNVALMLCFCFGIYGGHSFQGEG